MTRREIERRLAALEAQRGDREPLGLIGIVSDQMARCDCETPRGHTCRDDCAAVIYAEERRRECESER